MSVGGWIAAGLMLFLFLIGGTIAYVAVTTVGARRTPAQRDAGLQVLAELRQMARDVLDTIRALVRRDPST